MRRKGRGKDVLVARKNRDGKSCHKGKVLVGMLEREGWEEKGVRRIREGHQREMSGGTGNHH